MCINKQLQDVIGALSFEATGYQTVLYYSQLQREINKIWPLKLAYFCSKTVRLLLVMTQSKDDAKMDSKKAENSLLMEKHMDVLQACVMLPTPSWPMMSTGFLSAELKAKKDTDSQV